jgi:hypothetical protein
MVVSLSFFFKSFCVLNVPMCVCDASLFDLLVKDAKGMFILVHVRSLVFPFSCLVFLIQLTTDFPWLENLLASWSWLQCISKFEIEHKLCELREVGMSMRWRQLNHAS